VVFRGCIPSLAAAFVERASAAGLDTQCARALSPAPFFIDGAGPAP
jgi:hypothetical protein